MPTPADEKIAHKPTDKTAIAGKLSVKRAVLEVFCEDHALLRRHNVKPHELEALSRVATLGSVRRKADLIFILSVIRRARRR